MTSGGPQGAELVLVNGKIRTQAHPSGFTQAAAIRGGVIQALRGDDEIRDFTGPFTRVLDLRGRLVNAGVPRRHAHRGRPGRGYRRTARVPA
jgi:predicted amidohydrolase YtcJ